MQIDTCKVPLFNPKTELEFERALDVLYPDVLAEAIFNHSEDLFCKLFFAGTDAAQYWQHCEQYAPWWREHPASKVEPPKRGKLIPLSLYGDEVQSFRNTEGGVVSVLAWSSDLSAGQPPLSRYFPISCIPDHYCVDRTYIELFKNVAKRLQVMCDPEQHEHFAWSAKGYQFVYSSTQGDLKWVCEKFSLHNYRKNGFCSRCACCKNHEDLGMTLGCFDINSTHRTTRINHEGFFAGIVPGDFHPVFSIPGARLERVLHDVCHSQLLGTGKALNGSVLTFMVEAGRFGAWQGGVYQTVVNSLLQRAYKDFNHWKKEKKLNVTQPRFTASRLSRPGRTSYPSLNSKAAAGKAISFWMCDRMCEWAKREESTELDKQVAHCIWSYCEVLRIMDEAGPLLTREQGDELFTKGMQHLKLYSHLNAVSSTCRGAHSLNRALWMLLPKHHHFEHMLDDASETLINPNFYTLLCAESFIGQMGRVARTCHRSSLTLRVLQKYKLLLALHCARMHSD